MKDGNENEKDNENDNFDDDLWVFNYYNKLFGLVQVWLP